MNTRHLLTAITAGLLTLTACTTTDQTSNPSETTVVEPVRTPDDLAQHTRQTFDLTWGLASETERDTYCTSLALLGPDRAADEMAQGGGFSDDLDWDLMVELMQTECDNR
ncbi:hypothetical protein ABZ753_31040 [Streptomyces griseoincarnatus]